MRSSAAARLYVVRRLRRRPDQEEVDGGISVPTTPPTNTGTFGSVTALYLGSF